VEPPPRLFKINQRKIVALRMDPGRLRHIREERLQYFHDHARQAYVDAQTVQQEVAYSDGIYKQAGWPVVDTSLRSLEETAVEVVSLATDLPYRRNPEET
jgi:regulator of PEP synthase PpsR (kinase-PPPase family)